MANLSQEKRERMLAFLNKVKEEHKDDDETLIALDEIENELNSKKYGLVWEKHEEEVDRMMQDNIPVLTEVKEREIKATDENSYNFLLEGDNLHSLKLLEKTHAGKIDVIYIDPPYNTDNQDFIYDDSFIDKTDGYTHSKWLSFMSERLEIAKKLLSDEGVIFISIDDNEQAQLKLLCDIVLGAENFIAEIIRNTNSSKNQSLYVSVSHEYCLIYSRDTEALAAKYKDKKWATDKNNVEEYVKKVAQLKKMGLTADEITTELKELTKYPRFIDFTNYWYFDERGLYQKDNLGGVKNGNTAPIMNPLTGKEDPVPPGGFRYNAEKLQSLIADNRIHFHTDGSLPRLKRYLSENMKQRPKSIMSDDQRPDYTLLKNMKLNFDNPKQMTFMKRILSIFSNNSIFLDFFAGSGTTAHAVLELNKEDGGNRKFILCTNNENNICEEVTYERIKRVIHGYSCVNKKNGDETINVEGIPANLKYFKTDFISKDADDVSEALLSHIKEMVELENGITLDNKHYLIILSDEQADELAKNWLNYEDVKAIYVSRNVLFTSEQNALFSNTEIHIIPDYYFEYELKEVGETW